MRASSSFRTEPFSSIRYRESEPLNYRDYAQLTTPNRHYGTREDAVFLIDGIPVLVLECKNANKDEAIAQG